MSSDPMPLAVVTGASSGIGLELARVCAAEGHTVVMVADGEDIESAAQGVRNAGGEATAVRADLAAKAGVDALYDAVQALGRPVDILMANAGRGLGGGFLDQRWIDIEDVIGTNIMGTTYLLHRFLGDMRARGKGRVLITGSIAGYMPGAFNAVYNASKAYGDLLAFALRSELQDSGVSVTCLMPDATETDFFERAGMEDTKLGERKKADPADVARQGYDAMMKGASHEVIGWAGKLQALAGKLMPNAAAALHRRLAEPGSARQ